MRTTSVENWATDVKNWATEQGSGPNLGHFAVPDSGQSWDAQVCPGLPRHAQDCTATSSNSLSRCSVLNLVC